MALPNRAQAKANRREVNPDFIKINDRNRLLHQSLSSRNFDVAAAIKPPERYKATVNNLV